MRRDSVLPLEVQGAVDAFHREYYGSESPESWRPRWLHNAWMGHQIQKCPIDLHIYQEIITLCRPSLIIEAGTSVGGSALFFAHMLELAEVAHGRVVTIDLHLFENRPRYPRITYVTGDSVDPGTVSKVIQVSKLEPNDRVMVVLDSNHSKQHVLSELEVYSPLVTVGQYLVVEDTNVGGHPVTSLSGPGLGDGPWDAVYQWLPEHPEFAQARSWEMRFLLTFNPGGWLERIW